MFLEGAFKAGEVCGTQKQSLCGLLACKAWEEVLQSTKSQPAHSVCSAVLTWGLQVYLHLEHSLHSACRQGNSCVDGEVPKPGHQTYSRQGEEPGSPSPSPPHSAEPKCGHRDVCAWIPEPAMHQLT